MIRQDLDVVPTVLPKYRLEEDARQAAERQQRRTDASNVQIKCFPIILKESDEGEAKLRLFSVLPSPETGSCIPETLHVVEAPKRHWKRVRRTVYHGTMPTTRTNPTKPEEGEGEEGEILRFTSLPMPEYEDMACFLLTLPPDEAEEGTGEAVLQPMEGPLHALRYERVEAPKEGQGISSSWYSGLNAQSVGFKRNYIDDDGEEDDAVVDNYSDKEDKRATQRRPEKEAVSGPAKKTSKVEAVENNSDKAIKTLKEGDGTDALSMQGSILSTTYTGSKTMGLVEKSSSLSDLSSTAAATPDFSGVAEGDITGLTTALLQQWSATGRAAAPFAEVARVVLKAHPQYTEMKAKHQSKTDRQEAVEWFRVSQATVRTHILHLGYMMDSSNTVHLTQQKKK